MDGPDLSVSQARRVPHRRRPLMPLSSRPSNYNLRSHGEATAVDAAPVVNENEEEQAEIVEEELVSSNMASNVFRLETFKGDGTQKIDTYLKRFDQYKACTGLNDTQALAALSWHLDGNARLWYEQLDTVPDTLEKLRTDLTNKYTQTKVVDLCIYSMVQKVGETVGEFLQRLECETYKNKVSDDLQVQIALKGMDRTIASAISTHEPKTLDDVKKLTLRMGSFCTNDKVNSQVSVAAATAIPSKLETTVEVLTAAVAKLATTVEETKRMNQTDEGCGRCGGRCSSLANCRAMGKICYKCNKPNHFGNKCRSVKKDNPQRSPAQYGQSNRQNQYQFPRPQYPANRQ